MLKLYLIAFGNWEDLVIINIALDKANSAKKKIENAKSMLIVINNDSNNPAGAVSEDVKHKAIRGVVSALDELHKEVEQHIKDGRKK